MRYLKGTIHEGLFFPKVPNESGFKCYSDANLELVMLYSIMILQLSGKVRNRVVYLIRLVNQKIYVSRLEWELQNMTCLTYDDDDKLKNRTLTLNCHIDPKSPLIIHEDNQSCIKALNSPFIVSGLRQIRLKCHWIRREISKGIVKVVYVPTDQQKADGYTKI